MKRAWNQGISSGTLSSSPHPPPPNFPNMAAFNWSPDLGSNAPSSFIYDLYGHYLEMMKTFTYFISFSNPVLLLFSLANDYKIGGIFKGEERDYWKWTS